MAVRPLVLYPDPVLLKPTRKVESFDGELRELVGDMVDTMYAAAGVGLAANQIGVPLRVLVTDASGAGDEEGVQVFINPVITEEEGSQVGEEGCLSFPDITLEIDRAEKITVEALDLQGEPFTFKAEGLLARAILHECEHLDGLVFLQNVSALKRELLRAQIKKRINAGDWRAVVS